MTKLNPQIQALVDKIKVEAKLNDPAQVQLVTQLTLDSSVLAARAAAGEDVSTEAKFLKASLLNIAEHARDVVANNIMAFFTTVISNVLARALLVG